MGDKWTTASQSGGRAGSGSSGVWGAMITSFPTANRNGHGPLATVPAGTSRR